MEKNGITGIKKPDAPKAACPDFMLKWADTFSSSAGASLGSAQKACSTVCSSRSSTRMTGSKREYKRRRAALHQQQQKSGADDSSDDSCAECYVKYDVGPSTCTEFLMLHMVSMCMRSVDALTLESFT